MLASYKIIFSVIFFFVDSGSLDNFDSCRIYGDICLTWKAKPCCDPELECKAQDPYGIYHCVEKEQLGRNCAAQKHCKNLKNARCSADNRCICFENYVPVNSTTCLPNLGEPCQEKECYPTNSQCINGRCRCKEGYFSYAMKMCLPSNANNAVGFKTQLCAPSLGGFCTSDSECTSMNLQCIDYKCQCRHRSSQFNTPQYCEQPFNTIDCENDIQCSIRVDNSMCDRKCRCLPNYQFKNGRCLPKIGNHCADEQCGADNSDCIDHKCQCKQGYNFYYDNCKLVLMNISCNISADCDANGNALCSKSKCYCGIGFILKNNICVSVDETYCSATDQCGIKNSECIDNECKCTSDSFLLKSGLCLPTKLGQYCTEDGQCRLIRNAKCSRTQKCVCSSTYFPLNSTRCVSLLGGFCWDKSDCPAPNFECIDEKCQCSAGFVPLTSSNCIDENLTLLCNHRTILAPAVRNTTLLAVHLGSYCIDKTYCDIANSDCIDNKCQCEPNFASSSDKCVPLPLGHRCKVDSDCSNIENSHCSADKFCTCVVNHFGLTKYKCIPSLGGHCTDNSDCLIYASRCIDNHCQCKANYTAVSDSQCKLTVSLVRCTETLDCGEYWHSVCSDKKRCICREKNFMVNQWTCQPILGGPCWYDHQCITKNSFCIDFRCQCGELFTQLSDNQCTSTLPLDNL